MTETELKEKKLRVEDALSATRAAVEEGIVAGGGVAFINLMPILEKAIEKEEGDIKVGMKIVLRALEIPARKIASNSDLEPSVVIERIKHEKAGVGYNARTGQYVDMVKAGVVDPVKVTKSALQNAASIVGLLLTTNVLVADIPEDKPEAHVGDHGMGGMGGF